jgi:hypothetical protein
MMTRMRQRFNTQLSTRLKLTLLTAFLAFGMAGPSAWGKCFRDFNQPIKNPVIPALLGEHGSQLETINGPEPMDTAGITGLWHVTFTSGGETVDVAFDAWHSDGTEILNDYTNPIEGNVCLGVWTQTGPRTYRLKHPSWSFDESGNLLGTVIIRETVMLSLDRDSFKGTYAYDIYDTTGTFVEELTGNVAGTRITAD